MFHTLLESMKKLNETEFAPIYKFMQQILKTKLMSIYRVNYIMVKLIQRIVPLLVFLWTPFKAIKEIYTFRFFHFHQILHTRSPVSDTLIRHFCIFTVCLIP
jgi:hypothetical protein